MRPTLLDRQALESALGHCYRLEGELGEGGMGAVYLAFDRKHARQVAVKTVRPDLTTESVRQRFEREITITAGLQHPHILPLLDSGLAGETLFYVMPYVEGDSLERALAERGRLPVAEAVQVVSDVAKGLEHAHRHGVVHRDIKPGNILLAEGAAQIVDFGIAKALATTRDDSLTKAGLGPGSPNYMAPEQHSGEVAPASDIYALGAVLYECLTGEQWRHGRSPDWRGVPTAIRGVLERALDPSPQRRQTSADDFRSELRRAVARRSRTRSIGASVAATSLLAALVVTFMQGRQSSSTPDAASIAVLPLANLIDESEADYFVAGLHDALITEIGKVGGLKVISRTSVAQYAATTVPVPRIASELGVASILEGGVQRSGDRVRVTIQLIDGGEDQQLWARAYDEELTTANIFAIQSDIARQVASALESTLAPAYAELQRPPTESIEAYDLYTRGRYLYNRFATHDDRVRAAELFRGAIDADSAYALAYVGLAEAYSFLAGQSVLDPAVVMPVAREAAERALSLDDRLASAHGALGSVLLAELDYDGAERQFLRALELNPSSADVHRQYGRLLNRVARFDESIREARLAVELDPLSVGNRVSLTSRLFNARRFDEAIAEGEAVLELESDDVGANFFLGASLVMNGRFTEGIDAIERAADLDPNNPFRRTLLAFALARAGQRDEARKVLNELADDPSIHKERAIVLAEMGEIDVAFEYLERALQESPRSLAFLPADPTADSLRSDARLVDLLSRAGVR